MELSLSFAFHEGRIEGGGVLFVCRAEKSFTHRHLCEFTGLDLEMTINEHYNEVLDVLDRLFVYMFSGIKSRCGESLPCISLVV